MNSPLPATKKELRQLISQGKNLGYNRPLENIISDLSWPLPENYLDWKTKPALIPYISHDVLCWILNYICPDWGSEFEFSQGGNLIIVKCKLTIVSQNGIITRESTGSANLDDDNYGGPLPEAEAQSFRRAASKFGLGLYLYEKEIVDFLVKRKKTQR